MFSCHPNPLAMASSLVRGKLSWPIVSLYAYGAISCGKASPYVPSFFISSIIPPRSFLYSSSAYGLFKIHHLPFFNPSHPKQFSDCFVAKQYSISRELSDDTHPTARLVYPTPTVSNKSSES